jgi:hypothetical protein
MNRLTQRCTVLLLTAATTALIPRPLFADDMKKVNSLAEKCRAGAQNACDNLLKIAQHDKFDGVRLAAVSRLTDQQQLANFAMQDPIAGIRTTAAEALTDQSLLAQVAVQAQDESVRRIVVANLHDQNALARIAIHDNSAEVRVAALRSVTNPSILANVASATTDANLWQQITENLSDPAVLAPILTPQIRQIRGSLSRDALIFAPVVTITVGPNGWIDNNGWNQTPPKSVTPKDGFSFLIVEIQFEPTHPISISASDVRLQLQSGESPQAADALLGDPSFQRTVFVHKADGTNTTTTDSPHWEPLDGQHHQTIGISGERSLSWLFIVNSQTDPTQARVLIDNVPLPAQMK